jgi:hypothetical protein
MATLLTKERQTRRTTGAAPLEPGPDRRGWVGLVIALVAVIAVAATMFVVFDDDGGGSVAGVRPGESKGAALERLVNEGYIPKEALGNSSSDADAAGAESPGTATDPDGSTSTGDGEDAIVPPSNTESAREGSEEQDLTERFQNEGLIPR